MGDVTPFEEIIPLLVPVCLALPCDLNGTVCTMHNPVSSWACSGESPGAMTTLRTCSRKRLGAGNPLLIRVSNLTPDVAMVYSPCWMRQWERPHASS
jgi:hypothetical protein